MALYVNGKVSGGWSLLDNLDASGNSPYVVGQDCFSSDYKNYKVIISDWQANNKSHRMRVRTGAGTTEEDDYTWNIRYTYHNGYIGNHAGNNENASDHFRLGHSIEDQNAPNGSYGPGAFLEINFYDPLETSNFFACYWHGMTCGEYRYAYDSAGEGMWEQTTAVTGLEFLYQDTTAGSGNFKLYGHL